MTFEQLVPWRKGAAQGQGPMSALSSLQEEMNRMFNNMWSSPGLSPPPTAPGEEMTSFFYPDIEMSESDGHIEVSAELPGVSDKDMTITLSPDGTTLSIKGEKKISKEKKGKDYYCAERSYGSFRRTMTLPVPVNSEKVSAKFKHGVLEIKLEKLHDTSSAAKHIQISS